MRKGTNGIGGSEEGNTWDSEGGKGERMEARGDF